jgi:plastocyanin
LTDSSNPARFLNATLTARREAGRKTRRRAERARGRFMLNQFLRTNARFAATVVLGWALMIGFGTLVGLALPQLTVSQKGRNFNPNEVTIKRGEAVLIVNDDADLRHHLYVDSDKFNFDSGDQEPGSKTALTFPIAGTFDVLCAIHPKMKLVVEVK